MYNNKIGVYRDVYCVDDGGRLKGATQNKVTSNFTNNLEKDLRNIKRESISKDHLIQRLEFQLELSNKHHEQEKCLLQKRLTAMTDQHMSLEKTVTTLRQDNDNLHKQISFVQTTNSALQRRVTEVMRQLALERTRYQTEITGLKRKIASQGMQGKEQFTKQLSPRVVINHQAKIYRDCLKEQQKHYDEEIVKFKDRPGVYGLNSLNSPDKDRPGVYGLNSLNSPDNITLWRKGTPSLPK